MCVFHFHECENMLENSLNSSVLLSPPYHFPIVCVDFVTLFVIWLEKTGVP